MDGTLTTMTSLASAIEHTQMLLYVQPVGETSSSDFDHCLQLLRAHSSLSIDNLPKPAGYSAKLSPFPSFSWKNNACITLQFNRVPTDADETTEVEDVHACNRVLGVIGIHCGPTDAASLSSTLDQFHQSIQTLPDLLIHKCLSFQTQIQNDSFQDASFELILLPQALDKCVDSSITIPDLHQSLQSMAVTLILSIESAVRSARQEAASSISFTPTLSFLDTTTGDDPSSNTSKTHLHSGRQLKLFADYAIILGCPLDAAPLFTNATQLLSEAARKSDFHQSGDLLWLAASIQGQILTTTTLSFEPNVLDLCTQAFNYYKQANARELQGEIILLASTYLLHILVLASSSRTSDETKWMKRLVVDTCHQMWTLVPHMRTNKAASLLRSCGDVLDKVQSSRRALLFYHASAFVSMNKKHVQQEDILSAISSENLIRRHLQHVSFSRRQPYWPSLHIQTLQNLLHLSSRLHKPQDVCSYAMELLHLLIRCDAINSIPTLSPFSLQENLLPLYKKKTSTSVVDITLFGSSDAYAHPPPTVNLTRRRPSGSSPNVYSMLAMPRTHLSSTIASLSTRPSTSHESSPFKSPRWIEATPSKPLISTSDVHVDVKGVQEDILQKVASNCDSMVIKSFLQVKGTTVQADLTCTIAKVIDILSTDALDRQKDFYYDPFKFSQKTRKEDDVFALHDVLTLLVSVRNPLQVTLQDISMQLEMSDTNVFHQTHIPSVPQLGGQQTIEIPLHFSMNQSGSYTIDKVSMCVSGIPMSISFPPKHMTIVNALPRASLSIASTSQEGCLYLQEQSPQYLSLMIENVSDASIRGLYVQLGLVRRKRVVQQVILVDTIQSADVSTDLLTDQLCITSFVDDTTLVIASGEVLCLPFSIELIARSKMEEIGELEWQVVYVGEDTSEYCRKDTTRIKVVQVM